MKKLILLLLIPFVSFGQRDGGSYSDFHRLYKASYVRMMPCEYPVGSVIDFNIIRTIDYDKDDIYIEPCRTHPAGHYAKGKLKLISAVSWTTPPDKYRTATSNIKSYDLDGNLLRFTSTLTSIENRSYTNQFGYTYIPGEREIGTPIKTISKKYYGFEEVWKSLKSINAARQRLHTGTPLFSFWRNPDNIHTGTRGLGFTFHVPLLHGISEWHVIYPDVKGPQWPLPNKVLVGEKVYLAGNLVSIRCVKNMTKYFTAGHFSGSRKRNETKEIKVTKTIIPNFSGADSGKFVEYNNFIVDQYDIKSMINVFLDDIISENNSRRNKSPLINSLENIRKNNSLIIKGTFESLDDQNIAVAYGFGDNEKVLIKIDPKKWESSSDIERWFTIYHELGHDILNLKHGEGGRMKFNFSASNYSWSDFMDDRGTMFDIFFN